MSNYDTALELIKKDIREIQVNRRGKAISQCHFYEELDKLGIPYGIHSYRNGKIMGLGHRMDLGVRRDLFRPHDHFYIRHNNSKIELPNNQKLWDTVMIELREENINKALNGLD